MVKNGVKGLKKAKILEDKSKVMSEIVEEVPEPKIVTNNEKPILGKELRQSLVTENAYIAELLSIVNFPKREDSDNDDGKILIFLL